MPDPHPDLWRAQGARRPHLLWDMVDGPMPSGLLGIGDPYVHLVDRRWTMFLGGFSTNFRNRLYRATLLEGGTLAEGPWQFDQDARGRTAALVVDPPRAAWDGTGMHTPSYVPPADGRADRIYYTGRSTRRHYGPGSRYAIGVLEQRDGHWHRRDRPILQGGPPRTSVLEPFVVHTEGRYRMWYQANPHEVGPGELPDYELRCTDSADGIADWSPPRVFASSEEGFFDNALVRIGERWVMVLARGSNLHAARNFPDQGLWCSDAPTASADRADWSPPRRLLDTDYPGTPAWMARGTYGPAVAFADPRSTEAAVFFTGTRAAPSWSRLALQHLTRLRQPPVPSPFFLATGAIKIDLAARLGDRPTPPRRVVPPMVAGMCAPVLSIRPERRGEDDDAVLVAVDLGTGGEGGVTEADGDVAISGAGLGALAGIGSQRLDADVHGGQHGHVAYGSVDDDPGPTLARCDAGDHVAHQGPVQRCAPVHDEDPAKARFGQDRLQ